MEEKTAKKKEMPIIRKMMIALVGGIVVGLLCLFLREQLTGSGHGDIWKIINNIFFQDITTEDGLKAIGIFYIVGQVFMNGLQLAIVPLVLISLSLAMCSISNATKLGRIAGKTLLGFLCFYMIGAAIAGGAAYFVKSIGGFDVNLPGKAAAEVATIDPYNPLTTIVNAVPSNITDVFSTNTRILAVVVVAIIIGISMHRLGEKAEPLKKVFESGNEVIQMYLNFLINKVGPFAIFCMIARTFAIYGIEYLKPAAAYMITAICVLLFVVVTIYPLGILITTGLNPVKFLRKIAKVGVFGFSVNSSAATLPLNTKTCKEELGCSDEITSFVLPMGMTINMNGTTIMHMVAVTFIATSAGLNVTPANLVVMGLLSICAAAGTPAIPVAGTTMIFTVLSGLGFTTEACMMGYALVVAINRLVEMVLLSLNVIGDAATNVIVCAKEGELDRDIYNS